MVFKDLTGQRFGKLFVVSLDHIDNGAYWNCQCDCGNSKVILTKKLKKRAHCGCSKKKKNLTTEQFILKAILIHGNRYDYSRAVYISAWEKVIIICKEHGEFSQAPANHLYGQNCPICAKVYFNPCTKLSNKIIDMFLLDNNILIKRIGEYLNSYIPIEWLCLECNHHWFTSSNSIRQGGGCPICKDTRLNNDYIDKFLIEHNIPLIRIEEYINSYIKIKWRCLKCDYEWMAQPCEIIRKRLGVVCGSGCPLCKIGKNERRVSNFIINSNLEYQKICIRFNDRKYFPDFYIPFYNLIIEYNGIQHYQPIRFGNMTQEDALIAFEKQKLRDAELRTYCNDNNIRLLEIDGRTYKSTKIDQLLTIYFGDIRKGNENE